MSKYKQCMYTVILILTCLVASPFIYKQIWDSSAAKAPKAHKKEPVVISSVTTTVSEEPETTAAPEEAEPAAEEEITEAPTEPPTAFVTSDPSYFDDALFIGDSRTVGIKEYGSLKNADYFCSVGLAAYKIDSEYIDGYTLADKLSSRQYGKVYIMLGINEVANDPEYTISAQRTLIENVRSYQPNAIIYLEGNLHVTNAAQTESITNEGIDALNTKLRDIAENTDNIYYIDINEVFDDETGALTAEYTSDGIHVLGKYYETWCEWFCANTIPCESPAAPETETPQEAETAAPEVPAEQNDEAQNSADNADAETYAENYEQY